MRTKKVGGDTQGVDRSGKSERRKVTFSIAATPESEVALAGSFNNWDPAATRMKLNGDGTFVASLKLPVGRHEYKFVVNGVWQPDPNCSQWIPNMHGSLNSVIEVM